MRRDRRNEQTCCVSPPTEMNDTLMSTACPIIPINNQAAWLLIFLYSLSDFHLTDNSLTAFWPAFICRAIRAAMKPWMLDTMLSHYMPFFFTFLSKDQFEILQDRKGKRRCSHSELVKSRAGGNRCSSWHNADIHESQVQNWLCLRRANFNVIKIATNTYHIFILLPNWPLYYMKLSKKLIIKTTKILCIKKKTILE